MPIAFFLNKNSSKTLFDSIKIAENADTTYTSYAYSDCTHTTQNTYTNKMKLNTRQDMVEYVRCVMELLKKDEDANPYVSVDVMIPGFPNVCMSVKNLDMPLIARCLYIPK